MQQMQGTDDPAESLHRCRRELYRLERQRETSEEVDWRRALRWERDRRNRDDAGELTTS